MKTLIQIQEEYMDKVSASYARWEHKTTPNKGHYSRVKGRAYRKMKAQLEKLGFSLKEIVKIAQDADDMLILERNAA